MKGTMNIEVIGFDSTENAKRSPIERGPLVSPEGVNKTGGTLIAIGENDDYLHCILSDTGEYYGVLKSDDPNHLYQHILSLNTDHTIKEIELFKRALEYAEELQCLTTAMLSTGTEPDDDDIALENFISELKAQIEKPLPEPYAYCLYEAVNGGHDDLLTFDPAGKEAISLYTEPLAKKPLTDDEIMKIWFNNENADDPIAYARAVEEKHGIKDQE
jgi:hypothetical protein